MVLFCVVASAALFVLLSVILARTKSYVRDILHVTIEEWALYSAHPVPVKNAASQADAVDSEAKRSTDETASQCLEDYTAAFCAAALDPHGAVVTTAAGVNACPIQLKQQQDTLARVLMHAAQLLSAVLFVVSLFVFMHQ